MKVDQVSRLAAVLVLAATAFFGGLESVDKGETDLKPGEAFTDGPFNVTVKRASLWKEIAGGGKTLLRAKPGREYLVVVVELRNDGTVDEMLRDELDLRDLPDNNWVDAVRLADDTRLGKIGPGLKDELAFVWDFPEGGLDGRESVPVRIWKKEYRELAVSYGKAWIDTDEYGQMTVPLVDRR